MNREQPVSQADITSTEQTSSATDAKPEWLRALEQQSWQAELLVSGIAIFSTLKLPGLIYQLIDFFLATLPHEMMGWLPYFVAWYLIIASTGLIVCFILHFVARSFWIGLVGLISVYPEGIRFREDQLSPVMIEKLRVKYPDINRFSRKIDDLCSTIFAATFMFSMSTLGITVLIALTLILGHLLAQILPLESHTMSLVIGAVLLVLIYSNSILSLKALRHRGWVEKIHFPLAWFISTLMFSVVRKPFGYLSLTFRSNATNSAHAALKAGAAFIGIILVAGPVLVGSNAFYFLNERFLIARAQENVIYQQAYLDQRQAGTRILFPTIESFDISGKSLRVFVPRLQRETDAILRLTPPTEMDSNLPRHQRRVIRTKYLIESRAAYFTFYINAKKIEDAQIYEYSHPNKNEEGIMVIIPSSGFNVGENILRIHRNIGGANKLPTDVFIRFMFSD